MCGSESFSLTDNLITNCVFTLFLISIFFGTKASGVSSPSACFKLQAQRGNYMYSLKKRASKTLDY